MSFQPSQVPQQSTPHPGGEGVLGFLSQLVGSYGQAHQQQVDNQQKKQEYQLKQQQAGQEAQMNALTIKKTEAELGQQAQAAAQAKYQQLTKQIVTDPVFAKDPGAQAMYKQTAQQAGQIPFLKPDGSLDIDRMKPSFNEAVTTPDSKLMTQINNMPAGPAKTALLNQFSGVPKELYKAGVQLDAKNQVAMAKVNAYIKHGLDTTAIQRGQEQIKAKYYDELGQLIPSKIGLYQSEVQVNDAKASAVGIQAQAAASRAATYAQNVHNVMQRFQQSPNGSMGLVRTYLTTSTTQLDSARRGVADALKAQQAILANTPDPDSPAVQQAAQQVGAAQTALDAAEQGDAQLRASIAQNPQVAAYVSSASNRPATNITPPKKSSSSIQKPKGPAYGATPPGTPDGAVSGGYISYQGQAYKL